MGSELTCVARLNGARVSGRARLETDVLEFRGGGTRLSIPFKTIRRVAARSGTLTVTADAGTVALALGDAAEKWAFKIQHPPSRLDKIGVKPGWRVSALGVADEAFLADLERMAGHLSIGRVLRDSDVIFYGADKEAALARLPALKAALKPAGALWVIRPKGRPEISERAVMAAGKAAGLVDVKVVSFSATHTAEKFVIPVKDR
jgi:hypothetical protein